MSYKKTKADSTSVILYNSQKDHDKLNFLNQGNQKIHYYTDRQ